MGLVFAAVCLTAIATISAHAQTVAASGSAQGYTGQPGEGGVGSSAAARQNVAQSRGYDRAVATNRGFRQARMRGPISDPELRQSCLASFP
jgi:hypothetical protein